MWKSTTRKDDVEWIYRIGTRTTFHTYNETFHSLEIIGSGEQSTKSKHSIPVHERFFVLTWEAHTFSEWVSDWRFLYPEEWRRREPAPGLVVRVHSVSADEVGDGHGDAQSEQCHQVQDDAHLAKVLPAKQRNPQRWTLTFLKQGGQAVIINIELHGENLQLCCFLKGLLFLGASSGWLYKYATAEIGFCLKLDAHFLLKRYKPANISRWPGVDRG